MKKEIIIWIIAVIAIIVILSFAVMFLWNWLMPIIFGLPVLTFWESCGLIILCSILFGLNLNT